MILQADETQEILKIPAQYHSSLIGQNGKYAIRLEEKYSVKITFPRQSAENGEGKTREQLKPDEVLIKGGKKGVAGAKSELLEAAEFEKESNNVLKFTVPTRSVARILGRGGVSINEIKDNTDAQIDVEKGSDEGGANTTITVRGTKQAIAAAKAAILAISEQVTEEVSDSVTVESKFHRNIIGAGGQGLKELIANCGGPSDPKLQAGLIRLYVLFPSHSFMMTDYFLCHLAPVKVNPQMKFVSVESLNSLPNLKASWRRLSRPCVIASFLLSRSLLPSTVSSLVAVARISMISRRSLTFKSSSLALVPIAKLESQRTSLSLPMLMPLTSSRSLVLVLLLRKLLLSSR